MQPERIPYLLIRYLDNTISPPELDELMLFILEEESAEDVQAALEVLIEESPEAADYQESSWDGLYEGVLRRGREEAEKKDRDKGRQKGKRRRLALRRRLVLTAMAAVFIFLIAGTWLLFHLNTDLKKASPAGGGAALANDVLPGGDRALLTLADGSIIHLDSAHDGLVGRQGREQLIKSKGAQLAYHSDEGEVRPGKKGRAGAVSLEPSEEIQYNRLATPRGGQYRLVLPDGSKVWLNAATTLRYPVRFSGGERVVEMTGEAYFEITANPSMPFRVKVIHKETAAADTMLVTVLGTHFDIMAYGEEPVINTTLLEGLVKVKRGKTSVLVKPGEQAYVNGAGALNVRTADTEEAIAWKEGMFRFNEATIDQVMRQLSRWYDVEVVYVNGPPKDLFRGEMYRNVNASKILRVLGASGVHFTVEGKKIFVN